MELHFLTSLNIIALLLGTTNVKVIKSENAFTEKNINFNCTDGVWLSKQVCLPKGYDKIHSPNDTTTVITDFNWANFREVDDKKMTITFDLVIGYTWRDDRIKKTFLQGVGPINNAFINKIWSPGVYIENLKSYQQRSAVDKLKLEQLSAFNAANWCNYLGYDYNDTFTFLNYRMETHITLYCNFLFDNYPMDTQVCTFILGTSDMDFDHPVFFKHLNQSYCLTVQDTRSTGHALQDFDVQTKCYQEYGSQRTMRGFMKKEKDCVGFNITLKRSLRPFIMKYYLPSIAIVISAQISFIIPMNALPGRTALLATLFLSLINIFTAQQVRWKS